MRRRAGRPQLKRDPLGSYMASSTYLLCRIATAVTLWLLLGPNATAQSSWDKYQPGSISAVIARERQDVLTTIRRGLIPLTRVSAAPFPTRALVQYEDSVRPTSTSHLAVLTAWAKSLKLAIDVTAMFKSEVLFREDSVPLWIPTQAALIDAMHGELRRGDRLTLFVGYAGAQARDSTNIEWVFMANEFGKQ